MRNFTKQFIWLNIIFVSLLFTEGCQQYTSSFELKEGWKIVEKEKFSFSVPFSFVEKEIQGYENPVWEFEDSKIFLFVDFGPYTSISNHKKNSPDYIEKWVNINGQSARLISYRGESRKGKSTELKQIRELFFENLNYSSSNLLLVAEYEGESDTNIILTIFDSVKIK